jgi:2-polyprenyl-3-methyl-5-hydroxy-6-metoxy-1,4-benzoquinol methylase
MIPERETLKDQYADKAPDYFQQARSEMISFVPPRSRFVLEVGCGSGEFASLLKARLPDAMVWGIEPSPTAAAEAASRIDKVIPRGFGPGTTPELAGKKFDCVVFNDVLEHLVDPEDALRRCRDHLADDGVIVASIPNILFFYEITKILLDEDWQYSEHGILDKTHLRFFTRKSIVRLFQTAGYRVEVIAGINAFAGKKYKIANFLMLGRLRDWKYVQFAVRASVA